MYSPLFKGLVPMQFNSAALRTVIHDKFVGDAELHGRVADTVSNGNPWVVALASLGKFQTLGGYARQVAAANWGASVDCGSTVQITKCTAGIDNAITALTSGMVCALEVRGGDYAGLYFEKNGTTKAAAFKARAVINSAAVVEGTAFTLPVAEQWNFVVVNDGVTLTVYEESNPANVSTVSIAGWVHAQDTTPGIRRTASVEPDLLRWYEFEVLVP